MIDNIMYIVHLQMSELHDVFERLRALQSPHPPPSNANGEMFHTNTDDAPSLPFSDIYADSDFLHAIQRRVMSNGHTEMYEQSDDDMQFSLDNRHNAAIPHSLNCNESTPHYNPHAATHHCLNCHESIPHYNDHTETYHCHNCRLVPPHGHDDTLSHGMHKLFAHEEQYRHPSGFHGMPTGSGMGWFYNGGNAATFDGPRVRNVPFAHEGQYRYPHGIHRMPTGPGMGLMHPDINDPSYHGHIPGGFQSGNSRGRPMR